MAWLEEEGYIIRPHTSAGGVPSDKAYRYYVDTILQQAELSEEEKCTIRHLFHQVERELEEWVRLAATLLARRLRNVALVTPPQALECRLKHLELITLQEFLALLVLVLREAKLKRQLLTFEYVVTAEELTAVANKLNALYSGLTCSQIRTKTVKLSSIEEEITAVVTRIMEAEDERQYREFYLDGLRHLLSQPEFSRSTKVLEVLELLEEKSALRDILSSLGGEGLRVTIGGENQEQALQGCSLILSGYGIPHEARGAIGVIGPTRMPYQRAIPTVRYLSQVMSELVAELYGRS
jgi:heat-inducible transcriptional repressor